MILINSFSRFYFTIVSLFHVTGICFALPLTQLYSSFSFHLIIYWYTALSYLSYSYSNKRVYSHSRRTHWYKSWFFHFTHTYCLGYMLSLLCSLLTRIKSHRWLSHFLLNKCVLGCFTSPFMDVALCIYLLLTYCVGHISGLVPLTTIRYIFFVVLSLFGAV